jgi:hypothetical protein
MALSLYIGCPESSFTRIVKCVTDNFPYVQFLLAACGSTGYTLFSVNCYVIGVCTHFPSSDQSNVSRKLTEEQRVFLLETWWKRNKSQ